MADPTTGLDTGSSSSSGGLSGSSALGLGALGVGAIGLGSILGQGESPLPGEFSQVTGNAATMEGQGAQLFGQGQQLTGQGADALRMAQNGQLTSPQQSELNLYSQGLKNQTAQTYAGMGRNANQDTSAISSQAHNDEMVNAMAQKEIQSTIALGLGETQAGMGLSGQALGFESAANQALIAAGQAQLQQDKDYSTALTGAFSSIAQILGGGAMKAAVAGV
jgi:hypothetical protein